MPSFTIELGAAGDLVKLFSYPNAPGSSESLAQTVQHWMDQMLARDGFAAEGGTATVRVEGTTYHLDLNGSADMQGYVERLPQFFAHGRDALAVITKLKKEKKTDWPTWVQPPLKPRIWDPWDRGNWRYFLPIGMAMVRQRMVNFFHYPPMRLLDAMRDYLADPVPVRLIELMYANGVKTEEEAWLYSTVMDGAPIAAPDDEGTIYHPDPAMQRSCPAVHLLPIERFHDYQRAQTEMLLNVSAADPDYTVPIVCWGTSPRNSFNAIWPKAKLSSKSPTKYVEVLAGKKTPVLCSGHPYAFFAQVQTVVGAGDMKPEAWRSAVRTMTHDLAVVRWQLQMYANPAQDPAGAWEDCRAYWSDVAQLDVVYQLVLHQGSLWYPDPRSLQFQFRLSMVDVAARAADAAREERAARKSMIAAMK